MTMTAAPGFERRRFRAAAPYYLRGRPAYAPRLVGEVARIAGVKRTHRVMDLGRGPAQLAVALAPFAGEVIAIDPEPAMLEAAAANAAQNGVTIRCLEGSSDDLGPALGRLRLVVIGRAFHWMDRAETLQRLDAVIEPGGGVALFGDRHPPVSDNAWWHAYQELLNDYAAGDEARARRKSPEWLPDEAILLDSPFRKLTRIGVIERLRTPVENLVDRMFSTSSTTPARLGDDKARELAQKVRRLVESSASGGAVTEVLETQALLAQRPRPTPST